MRIPNFDTAAEAREFVKKKEAELADAEKAYGIMKDIEYEMNYANDPELYLYYKAMGFFNMDAWYGVNEVFEKDKSAWLYIVELLSQQYQDWLASDRYEKPTITLPIALLQGLGVCNKRGDFPHRAAISHYPSFRLSDENYYRKIKERERAVIARVEHEKACMRQAADSAERGAA